MSMYGKSKLTEEGEGRYEKIGEDLREEKMCAEKSEKEKTEDKRSGNKI